MSKFLVNKTPAVVILKDSKIVIPIGDHVPVPDAEVEHEDIIGAVNRGWIEIIDENPGPAEPFKPDIKFENAKPLGSLTIPGKEDAQPEVLEETPTEVKIESKEEAAPQKKGKKAAQ